MAALSRAKSSGFAVGETMTSAQANTIDANAAAGVKRANTVSGVRSMPLALVGETYTTATATTTHVTRSSAGDTYMPAPTTTGANRKASFAMLGLPVGHTLVGVTVRLQPSPGHIGEPAQLPVATLYSISSSGVSTVVAAKGYAWAGTAAYHAGVTLDLEASGSTVLSHTILSSPYLVQLRAESGQNATGQVTILGIDANVTVDTASGGTDFTHWLR